MNKLFLPFELATKLKEKGFAEDCLGFFTKEGKLVISVLGATSDVETPTPLYQQVIDWFDEKHRIRIYTKPTVGGNFTYGVYTWLGGAAGWEQHTGIVEKSFNTNNEAMEYAIEKSLELI